MSKTESLEKAGQDLLDRVDSIHSGLKELGTTLSTLSQNFEGWDEFNKKVFELRDVAKDIVKNLSKGDRKAIHLKGYDSNFVDEVDLQIRYHIEIPNNVFYTMRTIKEETSDKPGEHILDFVCV